MIVCMVSIFFMFTSASGCVFCRHCEIFAVIKLSVCRSVQFSIHLCIAFCFDKAEMCAMLVLYVSGTFTVCYF